MSDRAGMLAKALAHAGEETRIDRWLRRLLPLVELVCASVFVASLCFAFSTLWSAWQTASWDEYFAQVLAVLPGLGLLWRLPEMVDHVWQTSSAHLAAQELRSIATQGDAHLASRVDPQPEALEDMSGASLSIRLSNAPVALVGILVGLLAVLGLAGAGMAALAVWLITFVFGAKQSSPIEWWGLMVIGIAILAILAVGIGMLWLAVHFLIRLRRERHNNRYIADSWGVRRGEGGGQLMIPWHEVRAFYRFSHYPRAGNTLRQAESVKHILKSGSPRAQRIVDQLTAVTETRTTTTYVLDAGTHVLTWTLRPRESSKNTSAYTQLWRVIATYTRLPLRDLSGPVGDLLWAMESAKCRASVSNVPGDHGLPAGTLSGAPPSLPAPIRDWVLRWKRVAVIAPLAALLILYGGGWGLQRVQLAEYASLPARIHARKPLFTDALATSDGNWPVGTSPSGRSDYAYVDGTYQISGDGGEALAHQGFGDAAVEVTVRQSLTNRNLTMGRLGQIGLIVRAGNNPDHVVTFTIGPLGDWALMRFEDTGTDANDWKALVLGQHNSAVHDGFVPNRLLVLMRGSEYICYVNDQLVAVAHDDALRQGRVGLWLDDNTTVGHYSHFAVYPAV